MNDIRELNEQRILIMEGRVDYWEKNKEIPNKQYLQDLIDSSMDVEI